VVNRKWSSQFKSIGKLNRSLTLRLTVRKAEYETGIQFKIKFHKSIVCFLMAICPPEVQLVLPESRTSGCF